MITALCRTVILYFLIMIGLRLMGKRQIGELEPSELVLTMMISDLATVPMQDFGIPLLAGVIPILILLSLTLLMSQLSLLNLRFRALMCGRSYHWRCRRRWGSSKMRWQGSFSTHHGWVFWSAFRFNIDNHTLQIFFNRYTLSGLQVFCGKGRAGEVNAAV